MPAILIRDVPEEIHKKLKTRAATHRRSLGREALVLLEKALLESVERPTLEQIRAMRIKTSKPLTQEFFDEAKRTGRP